MADDNSSDGVGWLVAIALVGYLAYVTWWKEPEAPKVANTIPIQRASNLPPGPPITLSNGTVWTIVWDDLKGPKTARLAWVREDHSNNKKRDARKSKALYKIDCTTTGYVTLTVIDYDKDGQVIRSISDFSDEQSYPPPDSIIENVVERACLPEFDNIDKR